MFDPKNWYKPYGHPETGDLLKLSCGDFEVLWPSIFSCATSEMVVWFTGKPLFKPKMWPTGFSLPCFFFGGGHFCRRLPGRWKSNGWDRRCFLFIQIAWWIYPGGRVWAGLDHVQTWRGTWVFFRCLEPKKPDFSQMLMVQNFRVLHHSICSEKNSHHYIWLFAFDTLQVVHRWISELSTLKSWERSQWNIQLSRFWTLRVL